MEWTTLLGILLGCAGVSYIIVTTDDRAGSRILVTFALLVLTFAGGSVFTREVIEAKTEQIRATNFTEMCPPTNEVINVTRN